MSTYGPGPDPLAEIATRVRAQREEIAAAFVERLQAEVVDYRLADEELRVDVRAFALAMLDGLLDELGGGEPASDEELDRIRRAAARRVHVVSLEDFLRAWRIFGETAWAAVVAAVENAEPREHAAALEAAARLIRHVDTVTTAGARAYLDEMHDALSDLGLLRSDLLEALVAGDEDPERLRRRVKPLRVRLPDEYVVVVARGPDGTASTAGTLRRIVESVRTSLRPEAGPLLVGVRGSEVVALYPIGAGAEDRDRVKGDCAKLAAALEADGVTVGVSIRHAGVAEIAAGYDEARAAERLAQETGKDGRALAFDDVLIDHIVRSSPAIERALDATIRPLVDYDRARQSALVETLNVYVESLFNITKSAAVLHVHPNTVAYRLRRIARLTGRDVRDPNELLVLMLAVRRATLTAS